MVSINKLSLKKWSANFAVLLSACVLTNAMASVHGEELLTVGSQAPPLSIEHWVQDGGGKYQQVTEFKKGQVYVVEFWATWCPPCVQSMPHLAELQQKYDGKVQIVSISDEDLQTVEAFLERKVDGKDMSFRELTKVYCLTTDPDRSVYKDYMDAAQQGGIPTAFIVGKDARVEWIGHPMELEEVMVQVVENRWDRAAYQAKLQAEKEMQRAMGTIMNLVNEEQYDEAIKGLDTLLKKHDSLDIKIFKLQVLAQAGRNPEVRKTLREVFTGAAKDYVQTDMVAWNVYQMSMQGLLKDPQLLTDSLTATKAAVGKVQVKAEKASLLDTMAHLLAQLGKIDEAIEVEQQAFGIAEGRAKVGAQQFLQELQALKASK